MKLSRIAFMQPTVDLEVAPAPLARATIAERFEPAPPSRYSRRLKPTPTFSLPATPRRYHAMTSTS